MGFLQNYLNEQRPTGSSWAQQTRRTLYDLNTPERRQVGTAEQLWPTAENPNVARWVQAAQSLPGLNPAAAAALGQRIQTQGVSSFGRVAPDYWQRMMNLALGYQQKSSSIPGHQNLGVAALQGGAQMGLSALLAGR